MEKDIEAEAKIRAQTMTAQQVADYVEQAKLEADAQLKKDRAEMQKEIQEQADKDLEAKYNKSVNEYIA